MKYSLRNFLVVFLMSVVIFAVAAVFLVQYISSSILSSAISDESTAPQTTTPVETNYPREGDGKLNFLILGMDEDGGAEQILLVHIDRQNSVFLISSIPSNLRVSVDGGYQSIRSLAQTRGIDFVREKVFALTSMRPDYLISLDAEGFSTIVDLFGGVDYYVPQAMQESRPEENLYIDLPAGQQLMTGAMARQLIQYSGYAKNPQLSGAETCRSFVIAMCNAVLTTDNLMRATDLLQEVYDCVTTDMTYAEANGYLEVLFNFPNYTLSELTYPGHMEGDFYVSSLDEGLSAYAAYR